MAARMVERHSRVVERDVYDRRTCRSANAMARLDVRSVAARAVECAAMSELRFNSEWLGALGSEGMIRLAAKYTLARILERDDFRKRFTTQQPIAIHELLYPLAQGYDSVVLKCDVEMGGTDQLFNLLVGRDLMREYGLEPQVVITMPLLEGTDGIEKMSKSLGNYIGINEEPKSIFGKVMSISDQMVWKYYLLCTGLTPAQSDDIRASAHPLQ